MKSIAASTIKRLCLHYQYPTYRRLSDRIEEAGGEPLLGMTALESVGIEVDSFYQRLKRLPAVRLTSF